MHSFETLADKIFEDILTVNLNFDREMLENSIEPRVELEEEYFGPAHTMFCENTRVKSIEPIDRGSYVAKATVETERHGEMPVRFTQHTLTITCRDLGVINPAKLEGEVIPITYGREKGNRVFEDGNADICFTDPYTSTKEITDAGRIHEWRVEEFGYAMGEQEEASV